MMLSDEEYFDNKKFLTEFAKYEECIAEGRTPFLGPEILTDIADYYIYKQSYGKAHQAIHLALEMYPGAVMPLIFKAREAIRCRDLDKAEEFVAMIDDQDDLDVLYITSELMILRGRIEDTEGYMLDNFQKVEHEYKDDYAVDCATIWNDNGHYDKALTWIAKVVHANDTDVQELKGRILIGMQRYGESCEVFEKLVDKDPFSTHTWHLMACAQYMNKKYDEALQSTDFALAVNPKYTESLSLKGTILLKKEKFAEAIQYYLRYNELVPDDMHAYADLTTCYQHLEMYDKARTTAMKTLNSLDCDIQLRACEELVLIETACGNMEEAMQWARKAEKFCDDPSEPLVLRGHVFLCMKKPEEALPLFKEAIACATTPNMVKIRIIASLLDNGYRQLGLAMIRLYYESLHNVSDQQLESMTPETLIRYIQDKE